MGTTNPPKLQNIATTLKALAIDDATPWETYPDAIYPSSLGFSSGGLYGDDLPLSKPCVKSIDWRKHNSSHDHDDGPKTEIHGGHASSRPTKYTSSIVAPITLPDSHGFVPSFHSCFYLSSLLY